MSTVGPCAEFVLAVAEPATGQPKRQVKGFVVSPPPPQGVLVELLQPHFTIYGWHKPLKKWFIIAFLTLEHISLMDILGSAHLEMIV